MHFMEDWGLHCIAQGGPVSHTGACVVHTAQKEHAIVDLSSQREAEVAPNILSRFIRREPPSAQA